ncbi:C2 domain-containing protein [Psidium guajava]|nr:C2 domain-containing protein [Psidium guajava]
MEHLLGLLIIHVRRGVNLAIRDVRSSDPYVVIRMGKLKLKSRVVKKSLNPEWNDELTLEITDSSLPISVMVFDKDNFSLDDKMGDAEIHIEPFLDALRMRLDDVPSGTVITSMKPGRDNCLAEESCVVWSDGKVVQDMVLRLRNVEHGEVELQLEWIDIPGCRGL